jgi:hypothetical protein
MTVRKCLIPLAVMAAVAAIPASAQADVHGPAACVLTPMGVAGTSSVLSVQTDLADGVLLDTDTGTGASPHFTFSGTATCAGVNVSATPIPAVIPPGTYNISASGEFANLVCGTGTATGTATLSGGVAPNAVAISTTFGLVFVGGVGELSIAVTGGSINSGTDPINSGSGIGVVDIIPNATDPFGSNCITQDVHNFFVNGAFAAILGG